MLAAFPKLADTGTQHTTVEQDNVRFVYQPLDELYMVLITNRQSNILQDIDSLHLFAQVVTSTCRSLDEREILRNAYELLSAFDELVTLGYRENLTISQIKTFLEMESHEERIQEIISRVSVIAWVIAAMLMLYRIRSSRLQRRERRRQNSWKCSAKRPREVADLLLRAPQFIRHILLLRGLRSQRHSIHMKPRRTSRSSRHYSCLLLLPH